MITLDRAPDGTPVAVLPDHKGRLVRYWLRLLPAGHGLEMSREDGEGTYVVLRGRFGWSCACKAFAFSKAQPPCCKHIRTAEQYLDLVGPGRADGRGGRAGRRDLSRADTPRKVGETCRGA